MMQQQQNPVFHQPRMKQIFCALPPNLLTRLDFLIPLRGDDRHLSHQDCIQNIVFHQSLDGSYRPTKVSRQEAARRPILHTNFPIIEQNEAAMRLTRIHNPVRQLSWYPATEMRTEE